MTSTISNTLQLGHHFPHGLCKNLWPWPCRKCERCAAYSWVGTHLEESVQRSILHELRYDHHWFTYRRHKTRQLLVKRSYKEERHQLQRDREVVESAAVTSFPLCLSLGDNMACRHQSHWQLLISPLHKRQEIIRMDQSTRMCVCLCVCVWGGLLRSHEY